ncbi:Fanconi anemia group F protein [Pygocentrus nattereri]|uniref:FA complementation group F n=1 Tax=Pygocentrus nattereri TaxID=42514 RepID=A0A3B4BML1_PYGNA|nr:Fanconi anemia group F protein [Pygocentrus nattereri]
MEAVLENLGSTLELLAVSQMDFVSKWDAQTADRAFQWAAYCEHVYTRFHSNPSVRAVLEECLRLTNERLCEALPGHRPLSLSDLSQCRHRLLICLLRNPLTPYSVIKSLFDKSLLFEGDGDMKQGRETDMDLAGLIGCKSACKILGSFPLNPKGTPDSAAVTQTHVQGLMLLQRIHALQRLPGNDSYNKALLDAVLQDSGGLGHFSDVITASLLMKDSSSEHTAAQDFLLDWLQGDEGLLHSVCHSLSVEQCAKLSQQWPKFRLLYWGILKKWASSLEYDVAAGVWIQPCDSAVSFKTLVDHFMSLWSSPLKEETKKELVVLKKEEGDFDVQGLSVWTDLLIQLK